MYEEVHRSERSDYQYLSRQLRRETRLIIQEHSKYQQHLKVSQKNKEVKKGFKKAVLHIVRVSVPATKKPSVTRMAKDLQKENKVVP